MKSPLLFFLLLASIFGCVKKDTYEAVSLPQEQQTIENMQVSPDFTFNTSAAVDVAITALDNIDKPVPGIRLSVYTDYPENGGTLVMSGFTDGDGVLSGALKVPAYIDSVAVEVASFGFLPWQKLKISNNQLNYVLGGKTPEIAGRPVKILAPVPVTLPPFKIGSTVVKYMGPVSSNGVPTYLMKTNDAIDGAIMSDIYKTLPDDQHVPTAHPDYLLESNQTNLVFQQKSNVSVTYMGARTPSQHALCYYKYNVNNPPTTEANIDTLFAIFPKANYSYTGVSLQSGNRVSLGSFEPGTAIGWAIMTNAWTGTKIYQYADIYYTHSALNGERNPALNKHFIMLNDANKGKLLLAFEETDRSVNATHDFNDVIFGISVDPVQSVSLSNIPYPSYLDSDNDGVADALDYYPQDATRALNNYYPSQNSVGSLSFEDLWPSRGDYDFNDLVLDYNFNTTTNAKNEVVQIKATITTKAIGSSYHNGFGIQLPISPSLIASVTGTDVKGTLVTNNSNGTEAGQSKATIILYEDAYNQLLWPGSGIGVNTMPGNPFVQPKTLNVVINLTQPVSQATLGLPPYNSFIFTNKTRANEVHLINQPPTDLANRSLLSTAHDNSNPASGRYYVTAKNLPFAIDVAEAFEYPVEKKVITDAHMKFFQWGMSGGLQYKDWYKPVAEYRKPENIFSH